MSFAPQPVGGSPNPTPTRLRFSRAAATLAVSLIAASFLLLSPVAGATYPSAIPWSEWSILRCVIDVLSFGGLFQTERGAEIKDVAFHLAAAGGLAILALRLLQVPGRQVTLRNETWFHTLLLLGVWVGLSALSCLWSGDVELSLKQAALYAIAIGWAAALAGTLELPHLGRLMTGIGVVSAMAATLTIWFYFERNPNHRPGFPLGNPSLVAASLLPAMMLALAWVCGAVSAWRSRAAPASLRSVIGTLVILGICSAAFALAGSRGAILGLAFGMVPILFFGSGRRGPLAASAYGVMLVVGAGLYFYSGRLSDDAMARSATIRLRLYAWQYASEIWQARPMFGAGAATYTRIATQLSSRDRSADPAAFLGSWLESAHNEFFQIFSEIGLFGGVTFVAAWVALLAAAAKLLRSGLSAERRWLIIGIAASIVSLIGDAQFGVALRLPGGAALLWTLVGALLAACRCASRPDAAPPVESVDRQPIGLRVAALRCGVITVSLMFAALAVVNARALVGERRAYAAFEACKYADTVSAVDGARPMLLSPVRALFAEELRVRAMFSVARESCERIAAGAAESPPTSAASAAFPGADHASERVHATAQLEACHQSALALERRVPMIPGIGVIRARSAEMLAALLSEREPRAAQDRARAAQAAWRQHREQRPDDVATLLALTRYATALDEYVVYLRDALRAGFASPEWHAALESVASDPALDGSLARMSAFAAPIDPRTEIHTLIRSRAPEAYRLRARVRAARGEFAQAAADAQQAVVLYEPMKPRFPTLVSIALYEEAEYLLRAGPEHAPDAIAHLIRAVENLPTIQAQQQLAQAAPFLELHALCELAQGDESAALDLQRRAGRDVADRSGRLADLYVRLAELFVRYPPDRRPNVRPWLEAAVRQTPAHVRAWSWQAWLAAESGDAAALTNVLAQAQAAGVSNEALEHIVAGLRDEFPQLPAFTPGGP